jgi:hypothetical protein
MLRQIRSGEAAGWLLAAPANCGPSQVAAATTVAAMDETMMRTEGVWIIDKGAVRTKQRFYENAISWLNFARLFWQHRAWLGSKLARSSRS